MKSFYAQLNENNIVIGGVMSDAEGEPSPRLIPITQEQYENKSLVRKRYNRETGEFEEVDK